MWHGYFVLERGALTDDDWADVLRVTKGLCPAEDGQPCNKNHWRVWGIPNCGKGEPMQTAHVAHGASPSRFRNVKVGVSK